MQDVCKNDYEIIAVNDGSPDNCGEILKDYESNNSNLRVITQKNQGLSAARNAGLREAKGEYVWFVDSDDWIERDSLVKIFNTFASNPDLVHLNFQKVWEEEKEPSLFVQENWQGNIGRDEYISTKRIPAAVQFNIFRTQILRDYDLHFKEGILHEDIEFKPRAFHYMKTVRSVEGISYNYLQRTNSIMGSFKVKNGLDLVEVLRILKDFYFANVVSNSEQLYFQSTIGATLNFLLKGCRFLERNERKIVIEALFQDSEVFSIVRKHPSLKYKIEGIILQLFPTAISKFLI
jgi:glycosyltransferase involved in cell wall biosynthesis